MRKMTIAIIAWTVLWIYLANAGFSNTVPCPAGDSACEAGTAVGAGIAGTILFMMWFLGFVVLSIVWFMTRPRSNVTVYGPAGQQVQLTEKEARRRVERDGWEYRPRTDPPPA